MIAVLPAAGRGTRMAAVAHGEPKELLEVDGKPLLRHAIEEAISAGASRVVVISSSEKPHISEYIDEARRWSGIPLDVSNQKLPEGLGPAVKLAGGEDDAIVILPDTLYSPSSPARRLATAVHAGADVAISVEIVPDEMVSRYGIVRPGHEPGSIEFVAEKPELSVAPSRWAVGARYGLSRRMMTFLQTAQMNKDGETHLTPMINQAIEAGLVAKMIPLEENEVRWDCGSVEGWERAKSAGGLG